VARTEGYTPGGPGRRSHNNWDRAPVGAYGRLLTLGAVDEVEPGVLDDLDAQPFEALNRSSWNAERDGLLRYEVILTNPRLRDLRASLETWSDRWHLNDKWCLGIAVSTLTQKSGGERLAWFEPRTHFGGMAPPFPAPFPPPFGLRPYDPAREWRADYLDHARRVLNPKYQALEREMIMCLDATNCASSAIEQDRLLAHALGLAIRRDRSFYPRRSKLDCQEPSLPPSDIFRYVKDNLANLS
jgi:hypothetical protein